MEFFLTNKQTFYESEWWAKFFNNIGILEPLLHIQTLKYRVYKDSQNSF